MKYEINGPERLSLKYSTTNVSTKFEEFLYKRFRYFVKYSCAQENVKESSKSHDQRKWTRS